MTQALPLRVSPTHGETLASFVARWALKNGYEYATGFCHDLGFRYQDVADGRRDALNTLARLCGETSKALEQFAVKRLGESQYSVAGQLLEKRWIKRGRLRYCPECVRGDLMHAERFGASQRAYWHVPFIRTCHKHGCSLLETTKICHSRGPHDFPGRLRDLGINIDTALSKSSKCEVSRTEAYLINRMDGIRQNEWLDTLSFNAVAMTSETLGFLLEYGARQQVSGLGTIERRLMADIGFDCLSNGRDSVLKALADFKGQSRATGFYGRTTYGYFYNWLEQSHSDLYEPIREIMREHIISSYPIGKGELVLGKPCEERRLHSLTTARAETGIKRNSLMEILHSNGHLKKDPDTGKFETRTLFDADAVKPILASFKGSICQLAARKRLNAPRSQFDALLKHGTLKPIDGGSLSRPYYDPYDVDDLLHGLLTRAMPIHHPTKAQVDIKTACRKTVTGAAEIVDLIVSGKLKFVGRDPQKHGYLSVLVDSTEVAKLKRLAEPKGYMKHEIARFLGVNDPAIKYLETSGLLPFVKSRHPVSRKAIRIVTYDAMSGFLKSYLPCRYLAKQLNLTTRYVGSKLDSKDADRIEMPNNCRGKIYRRDDLFSKLNELNFFISANLDVFKIDRHEPIYVYNQ